MDHVTNSDDYDAGGNLFSWPLGTSGNLSHGMDMPIAPWRCDTASIPDLKAKRATAKNLHPPKTSGEASQAMEPDFATQHRTDMSCKIRSTDKRQDRSAFDAGNSLCVMHKEQEKQAKAAERRARGANATEEVVAYIDSRLKGLKHGKLVVQTFENSEIRYRYELREGELPDWQTITWHRDVVMGEELLSDRSYLQELMQRVYATFGAVSLSLTCVGLERRLMAKERADHRSAARSLDPSQGFSRKRHMQNLLSLHFWAEGIVYRDCKDAAQVAEHVLGITTAMAHQPYKGGEDSVAAFMKKKSGSVLSIGSSGQFPPAQQQVFKALAGAVNIGPLAAKAITNEHHSLGVLMQNMTCTGDKRKFVNELADLKAGARRVGPAAAKKLQWLLTCEDPNAKMI